MCVSLRKEKGEQRIAQVHWPQHTVQQSMKYNLPRRRRMKKKKWRRTNKRPTNTYLLKNRIDIERRSDRATNRMHSTKEINDSVLTLSRFICICFCIRPRRLWWCNHNKGKGDATTLEHNFPVKFIRFLNHLFLFVCASLTRSPTLYPPAFISHLIVAKYTQWQHQQQMPAL